MWDRPREKTLEWFQNADYRILEWGDLDPEFYNDERVLAELGDAVERGVEVHITYDGRADPATETEGLYELARDTDLMLAEGGEGELAEPRWYLVVDENVRMAEHPWRGFGGEESRPPVFFTAYGPKAEWLDGQIRAHSTESYE